MISAFLVLAEYKHPSPERLLDHVLGCNKYTLRFAGWHHVVGNTAIYEHHPEALANIGKIAVG